MREIADDVGIRTSSLYNYIDNKQNLLLRLMTDVMDELFDQTQEAVATAAGTPAERLRAGISAFVLFNIEHPHEAAVSDAGFSALTDAQRRTIISMRDRFDGLFTSIIDDGLADGSFKTAQPELAKVTMLSACARVYFWYRPDGSLAAHEVAATMSDYLVRGLTNLDSQSHDQQR